MNRSARLQQAYEHSRLNRRFMGAGAVCRCFHCLSAFPADQIQCWVDDGDTALCPNCGVDAVLSSHADDLLDALIQRLQTLYFAGPSKKYSVEEWRTALAEEKTRGRSVASGRP